MIVYSTTIHDSSIDLEMYQLGKVHSPPERHHSLLNNALRYINRLGVFERLQAANWKAQNYEKYEFLGKEGLIIEDI